ncbi:MAG: DNA gyrase subunit A [Patescibacteria group bacterium]
MSSLEEQISLIPDTENSATGSSEIIPQLIEETMQTSYLKYAMSVIVSRALPDVRDGLKPVHRRILYAMYKLNLGPNAKYRKCAKVVGDVLGNYHPHGDVAVYNALARLAQDFVIRYPLIDGQGNFGSIDGDAPASMRYTESRMAAPSMYLLNDLEKKTVDFIDNYDGSTTEPTVLPAGFPHLLVNGSSGIAVGMATEIPPHNLREVCEGVLALIKNPEISISELVEYIKAPDFPTGGIIYGKKDLINAYTTGRGRIFIRATTEIQDQQIIIKDIPYQVNKMNLLEKIAELVKNKVIENIKDIRDETNKEGVRIVIEVKRDGSPEIVLNQLYKLTEIQTTFNFNLLALVNRGRQPRLLNLKDILQEFLNHRYEVITRRTEYELGNAEARKHILDGLKIALDFIDEVVALIRGSKDKPEAAGKLMERFGLSDKQAEAILQMRLQTLTGMDKAKIEAEIAELIKEIARLREILEVHEVKTKVLTDELEAVMNKFNSPRRTLVIESALGDYNMEDFIADEQVLIQMTKAQYIKRLPVDTFRTQARGGRGVTSIVPKEDDIVVRSFVASTHDFIYFFTNLGRVFRIRAYDLPETSRTSRGQALVNFLSLQPKERVTVALPVNKVVEESAQDGETNIIMATDQGFIKKIALSDFKNVRKSGIIAITLRDGDSLEYASLAKTGDKVMLSSSGGKTVTFTEDELRHQGRSAMGVTGIKLKGADHVVGMQTISFDFAQTEDEAEESESQTELELDVPDVPAEGEPELVSVSDPTVIVITENGFGKRTLLSEFRQTHRATSGVKTLKISKKTGIPAYVNIVDGASEIIITTKAGVTIKTLIDSIRLCGRATQGVKVIRLDDGDKVVSCALV